MRRKLSLAFLTTIALSSEAQAEESSKEVWYRPAESEIHHPARGRYVPLALSWSPQVVTGGNTRGTLSTLTLNLPLATWFGLAAGLSMADAARFIGGLDLFRYAGVEIHALEGARPLSVLLAPTLGYAMYYGADAWGVDVMTAPVGVRTIVSEIRTMFEVRVAGHFLFGTDDRERHFQGATGIGLELVAAPLFWKRGAEPPLRPHRDGDEARGERTLGRSAE